MKEYADCNFPSLLLVFLFGYPTYVVMQLFLFIVTLPKSYILTQRLPHLSPTLDCGLIFRIKEKKRTVTQISLGKVYDTESL